MGDVVTMEGENHPRASILNVQMTVNGFLAWDRHTVWHWNFRGKLINKMGGAGEGPGEFAYISSALWDGKHYWVIDASSLSNSLFNEKGAFLFREKMAEFRLRYLIPTKTRLFCVDVSQFTLELVRNPHGHPPFLRELRYEIGANQLKIVAGQHFRKASSKQRETGGFNYKQHWITDFKNGFYVMNHVENRIWFYTDEDMNSEAAFPFELPSTISSKLLPLKDWHTDNVWAPKKGQIWWYNQCRINFLSIEGSKLVVGYKIPIPGGGDWMQRVAFLDAELRSGSPKEFMDLPGSLIGIKDGLLYSWRLNDLAQGEILITTPRIAL